MIQRFLVLGLVILTAVSLVGQVTAVFHTNNSLTASTFLGASLTEKGLAIAVDAQGNNYITGYTESTNFPGDGRAPEHGVDLFIAKFNPDKTQADYILWFDALNAQDIDFGYDIAVDDMGYAYVVGETASADFCDYFGTVPGYDTTHNGSADGFLLKANPDGTGLEYCTYLGGSDWDTATAVAIDAAGNAFVTGGTWSTDFITSANSLNAQHAGLRDLFVLKIDPTGTAVLHSSLLGGTGQEEAKEIALDTQNNVYLTGWTSSADFPTTTDSLQPTLGGNFDAFVIKLNAITPTLHYLTYLGGTGEDRGSGVRVDSAGNVYISGVTSSANFPTTPNSYDPHYNNGRDGFITKINPEGSALVYSTFLGGSGEDAINSLALDNTHFVYVTGETHSPDFPTTANAVSANRPGDRAAFVTILDDSGERLAYSGYLGGSDWDEGIGIVALNNGRVQLTGATRSSDFPVSPSAYNPTHNGDYDVYATTLIPGAFFTAVPSQGPPPHPIQFQNLTPGTILSSTWQFGDGSSSQQTNPTHTYTLPGSYTVTLSVNISGTISTYSQPNAVEVGWFHWLPFVLRP